LRRSFRKNLMLNTLRNALIGPALIVGGLFMFYSAYDEAKTTAAMQDHGKTAQAAVTQVEWKEKRGNDRSYSASITFLTEDGQEINTKTSISTAFGKQLREESVDPVMTIRYLPASPTTVQEDGHADASGSLYGIAALIFLIGVGIVAFRVWRARKAKAEAPTAADSV
jgi:hypothetical protein